MGSGWGLRIGDRGSGPPPGLKQRRVAQDIGQVDRDAGRGQGCEICGIGVKVKERGGHPTGGYQGQSNRFHGIFPLGVWMCGFGSGVAEVLGRGSKPGCYLGGVIWDLIRDAPNP